MHLKVRRLETCHHFGCKGLPVQHCCGVRTLVRSLVSNALEGAFVLGIGQRSSQNVLQCLAVTWTHDRPQFDSKCEETAIKL